MQVFRSSNLRYGPIVQRKKIQMLTINSQETHCVLRSRRMARDINVDRIKKLWILDLVIQQGSLKKASLVARVSPSAISQTLTSLENSYGRPLLVREKGSVTPTQDALSLLEIVRPAFDVFERLKDMSTQSVPEISWLNFGTYESIAIDLLPGLIHSLKHKLPNMRLGLRVSRTSSLLTMVRKGELCSALIAQVDDLSRFYVKDVAQDKLGLFVSKNHPIANMGARAIEEYGLGSLTQAKDGLPLYFTKFMKQFSLGRPNILSDSFETLRAGAAAGSIVSVLPHRVAARDNELLDISLLVSKSKKLKEEGTHSICVVSQVSCDREETDFIAEEATRLLARR